MAPKPIARAPVPKYFALGAKVGAPAWDELELAEPVAEPVAALAVVDGAVVEVVAGAVKLAISS